MPGRVDCTAVKSCCGGWGIASIRVTVEGLDPIAGRVIMGLVALMIMLAAEDIVLRSRHRNPGFDRSHFGLPEFRRFGPSRLYKLAS
jgi:hypothetical protein